MVVVTCPGGRCRAQSRGKEQKQQRAVKGPAVDGVRYGDLAVDGSRWLWAPLGVV